MKANQRDVIRPAVECRKQLTSNRVPCRTCGRRYDVMHFRPDQLGSWCPQHCGCNIGGIVDHDAVAGALVLVDD